ncbi:hypothetical protein P5673_005612 [Acropora cervicornis]|uniref:Uncharacterized protein n=1 Tax=Acropora cervicornis TaxID=6130 RepID=A0AAD9QYN4_ACRCE|nr:hypothetical protein P5673_005612 [Acropora cervicornis]
MSEFSGGTCNMDLRHPVKICRPQIKSFHVCRRGPLNTTIQRQNRLAVSVAYIVAIYMMCNIPVLIIATAYLYLIRDSCFLQFVDQPDWLLLEKPNDWPSNVWPFCQRCLFERAFTQGGFK